MTSPINEKFFFDQVRLTLFDGSLKTSQVSGIVDILAEWSRGYSADDDRWLAYALGTAHHETGRTMLPIHEWGGKKYFFDMYDPFGARPAVAKRLGNTEKDDGVKFHGRGYVQLTGRSNYTDWGHRLGLPLADQPDLVIDSKVSAKILFGGMKHGTFTGKKLGDYFSPSKADWNNARRIINGMDKYALVASYALKYYAAISYTR